MTDPDGLRRRYRRLLWAYPNWYRRERGQEILTTLLDAAQPGQRRPTGREVLDVLGQGIRCRLWPPRGLASWTLTLVLASFAALAGAIAAGASAIATLAPPPTEQQAIAMAEVAMGQRPENIPGPAVRCPDYCDHRWQPSDSVRVFDDQAWDNGGLDHTTVMYWSGGPATMDQAQARLLADGWTIDAEPFPRDSLDAIARASYEGFTARRGDLALHVHRLVQPAGIALTFEQSPPAAPLNVIVVIAGAGGLLVGWMAATWVWQRYRRHTNPVKAAMVLLGLPSLALMLVMEATALGHLADVLRDTAPAVPLALLPVVSTSPLVQASMAHVIAVATGLAILVAALPLPAPRHRARSEAADPSQA